MPADFAATFKALKSVFAEFAPRLSVKTDTPIEYTLLTRSPSPFPQHKGQPMFFSSVRVGKAYVSLHLLPLYMCPPLTQAIPPALRKRMQGKACFNFKSVPEPELLAALKQLTAASIKQWDEKKWL
jgi:hypothetical protein